MDLYIIIFIVVTVLVLAALTVFFFFISWLDKKIDKKDRLGDSAFRKRVKKKPSEERDWTKKI